MSSKDIANDITRHLEVITNSFTCNVIRFLMALRLMSSKDIANDITRHHELYYLQRHPPI